MLVTMRVNAFFLLVIVVATLTVTVDAQEKSKCEKEAKKNKKEDMVGPDCLENGDYNPKQCNETICWCVKKKNGKPNFGGIMVPLNYGYNCRKRPRACLRETLRIMLEDPTAEKPECNRKGWYKPMQCEVVKNKKCKGKTNLSREKRQTPVLLDCDNTDVYGFDGFTADKLDTADTWTMVDVYTFDHDGEIAEIELTVSAAAAGRPLKIGVYQPTPIGCQFTVEQQITLSGAELVAGDNTIEFPVGARLRVVAGQQLGFTWNAGGVVQYEQMDDDDPDVNNNYCEDAQSFEVDDVATLQEKRYGYRKYKILATIVARTCDHGYDLLDRGLCDEEDEYTFVMKAPFPDDGQVTAIEFWVCRENVPIRFGLYRPTPGTPGQFTVERQLTYDAGFPLGFNRVELTGSDIIDVQTDDLFGFAWTEQGVISYENTMYTNYFYHKDVAYDEGNTIPPGTFVDTFGKRMYSVQVEYVKCTHALTAKEGPCVECFCVDKKGNELDGTRTTDVENLDCDVM